MIAPDALEPLNKAAGLCATAEQKAREAAMFAGHDTDQAEKLLRAAGKDAAAARALLVSLGASERYPMKGAIPHEAKSNPLAELARVESSRAEALALLDALRTAHQLAEVLDAKRGDVLPEPIGGSAGLVWGDRLIQAVCGLELELYGPSEAVTKGRE